MEVKIDTKESLGNIEWYQHSNNIYIKSKGETRNCPNLDKCIIETKINNDNFSKIGGDLDIAFYNEKFVLCKDKNLDQPQKFVYLDSLILGFDACQKIPHRYSCKINKKIIYEIVLNEQEAIDIFNQFNFNENYFGEITNKIYLYFGNTTELNPSNPLHRKNTDIFLNKIKLDKSSQNNHDIKAGWYPLGYPFHLGLIENRLCIFKEKTEKLQDCVEIKTKNIIKACPKSLDETNSWFRISNMVRQNLISMVEESKKILIYNTDHKS